MASSYMLVVFIVFSIAAAKERPLFQTKQFDTSSATHRQNVCDRQQQLDRGELSFRNALRGLNLTTGLFVEEYVNFRNGSDDGDDVYLDPIYPGLIPVLMDELARRGDFNWRYTYGNTFKPELTPNRTFTDLLVWTAEYYDVSADWWPSDVERLERHVQFQEPWYDASLIIIQQITDDNEEEGSAMAQLFSFVLPFTGNVWILLGATIAITTALYMVLERIDPNSDEDELEDQPGTTLFLSVIAFTGHFEFQPKTNPARLLLASLTFLALLLTSAYTANLASFFVIRNTSDEPIRGIEDVIRNQKVMCVSGFTDAERVVRGNFPNALFVRKPSEEEIFIGVQNGDCDVAVTTVVSWRLNQVNRNANPDCNFRRIEQEVLNIPASFGFKSDSGTYCTSLIRDVLHIHMVEMVQDGFVDEAWENELLLRQTINCDAELTLTGDADDDTVRLGIMDLGGAFVIHYIFTGLAILVAFIGRFWAKNRDQHNNDAEDSGGSSSISKADITDPLTEPNAQQKQMNALLCQLLPFIEHINSIQQQQQQQQQDRLSFDMENTADQTTTTQLRMASAGLIGLTSKQSCT